MSDARAEPAKTYGLRRGAEEFPLMIVLSIISTMWGCSMGSPPPVQRSQAPYSPDSSAIFCHSGTGNRSPPRSW